ncbi:nodulation protein NolB [Bradyrhizobium neotropicale]|uniref:nodulation protein NolB n=1 Tax=Bradyrhizobium neotropicale TaxID=1497615 RepID=UPI001AD7C68F|nr:nodulation protein NolB [Bradyrhizobium neotropicale]MBO4227534.1 nodulation protein NolB [Bradyrhizobium neotropicale]
MMAGVTPISANPVECLPKAGSSTQAQFHESLARAASNEGAASSVADGAVAEVQRAVTPASPLGDRILQNISSMHQGKPFRPSALPSVVGGEPVPPKSLQLGPAAQPILPSREVEVQPVGKPEGVDHFEASLANLRDVYNGVTQVSLISKSVSAVSSSLNKLLSAG